MTPLIQKTYSKIYSKVIGRPFELKLTKRNMKLIENFIKLIPQESIGENWMLEFMCFQFSRYAGMKTSIDIQLNWIIGKSAVEKWNGRTEEQEYWVAEFKRTHSLSTERKHESTISDSYMDIVRQRGDIVKCAEMSLYSFKKCLFCKNKDICREL